MRHLIQPNCWLRWLEGFSTGSMFMAGYLLHHNVTGIQYILFFHWISSCLYHMYPNDYTFYGDILGIHLISVLRVWNMLLSRNILFYKRSILISLCYLLCYRYPCSQWKDMYTSTPLFHHNKRWIMGAICFFIYQYLNHPYSYYYLLCFASAYQCYLLSNDYSLPITTISLYRIVFHLFLGLAYYLEIIID